ncbi:MAG: hypothetical protein Q8L29_02360 [archaeon]|nr:hypothetical protein [archaeon]
MNKKIALLLKAPAYLLIIAAFVASIYATAKNIQGISWRTPVILGLIIISYIIGFRMEKRM